jgi:hypothetical protein
MHAIARRIADDWRWEDVLGILQFVLGCGD